MFEHILVPFDLSIPSKTALEWALRIGEHFHSHLKVVHASAPMRQSEGPYGIASPEEMIATVRHEIDRDIRLLSQEGEGHLGGLEIQVIEGKPADALLKLIERDAPDVVILGTHGRTGLPQVFMGSVAEKIVRHSPSPVLVARQNVPWPPKRLLMPIDIQEAPDEALLMATQLCRALPMGIDLFHVFSLPDLVADFPEAFTARSSVDQKLMEDYALKQMRAIAAQHPSLSMTPHIATGPVAIEICAAAKRLGTDLILLPTHGRSGWSRLLIGSVTEQVVRYAPCHVMSYCPRRTLLRRKEVLQEAPTKTA